MTSATNIPVHVKKNRTAGDWAILILLIVGGLVMLFPFIVLLLNAFKTTADYNSSGPLSWPKEFSTVGLMKFWNRVNYPEKLWNSIWTSGLAQAILYRGAGFEIVWPQFLTLMAIGGAFFTIALLRFRKTIGTMA